MKLICFTSKAQLVLAGTDGKRLKAGRAVDEESPLSGSTLEGSVPTIKVIYETTKPAMSTYPLEFMEALYYPAIPRS